MIFPQDQDSYCSEFSEASLPQMEDGSLDLIPVERVSTKSSGYTELVT